MVQKIAAVTTYGGSGAAMYFGYTAHELAAFGGLFAALGGLLVAIIGLIAKVWIDWHFRTKELNLKERRLRSRPMTGPDEFDC